jgi:copper chaperone
MIEFTIPTMTCGHCVRTVTETVHQVDAQASVDIDLVTHRVRIESQRAREDFEKALADEGYQPA